MARKTKRLRMIESSSEAHSSRNKDKLQEAMNHMLWILAEGTRYEEDVSIAFDMLEQYHEARLQGRFSG